MQDNKGNPHADWQQENGRNVDRTKPASTSWYIWYSECIYWIVERIVI